MAQYQAYLHSNRVNWLVFHHKMSKFHHEMSKFHHKCPNSIIIPCKFRFLDEKIKLEDQKVEFLNTANHTQKNDKSSPLFGTLNNLKTKIYYSLTPALWPEAGYRWGCNDLNYKSAAAKPSVPLVTCNQTLVASLMG